jgi:hypothetical protein
MAVHLGRFLIALLLLLVPSLAPAAPTTTTAAHLRLLDRLDRPKDGYCVDIPGTGQNLRVEIPLFAHNCKPRLTTDSAVVFTSDGLIRFPAVGRCITVAGVNSVALPGAAILLRACKGSTPFFETSKLQRFTLRGDGRLALAGTELCLTVGSKSAPTYSPYDRWRTLFVDDCTTAERARSRWEFVVPRP